MWIKKKFSGTKRRKAFEGASDLMREYRHLPPAERERLRVAGAIATRAARENPNPSASAFGPRSRDADVFARRIGRSR